MGNEFEKIPQEMFEFSQLNEALKDKKLKTKSRGYLADALIRFRKNKSSIVAAYIILILVLYAIIAPLISHYSVYDTDTTYKNFPPFIRSIAEKKIGIFDGGITMSSQNEMQMKRLEAIKVETGKDPLIKTNGEKTTITKVRGSDVAIKSYSITVNSYYRVGVVYRNVSYEEFDNIQKFQNESGLQVLYPYVEKSDIYAGMELSAYTDIPDDSNLWYVCADTKGTPLLDAQGNFIPAYCSDETKAGPVKYNSLRIAGDDGSYIYSRSKSGSVSIRVEYYNFVQYIHYFLYIHQ